MVVEQKQLSSAINNNQNIGTIINNGNEKVENNSITEITSKENNMNNPNITSTINTRNTKEKQINKIDVFVNEDNPGTIRGLRNIQRNMIYISLCQKIF